MREKWFLKEKIVMTHKVITIEPHTGMDKCMQIMTDHHIRYLPVVQENKVLGLISISDVVKEMIKQQKTLIEELQKYISS